jgi:ubiquitin-conjugating enzyme E2 S
MQVIRCLLIVPFPESSLNDEAGKLFMESYDEVGPCTKLFADMLCPHGPCCCLQYKRRAKLMTAVHALRKDSKLDGDAAADGEQVEKKASKAKQSKKKALKRL